MNYVKMICPPGFNNITKLFCFIIFCFIPSLLSANTTPAVENSPSVPPPGFTAIDCKLTEDCKVVLSDNKVLEFKAYTFSKKTKGLKAYFQVYDYGNPKVVVEAPDGTRAYLNSYYVETESPLPFIDHNKRMYVTCGSMVNNGDVVGKPISEVETIWGPYSEGSFKTNKFYFPHVVYMDGIKRYEGVLLKTDDNRVVQSVVIPADIRRNTYGLLPFANEIIAFTLSKIGFVENKNRSLANDYFSDFLIYFVVSILVIAAICGLCFLIVKGIRKMVHMSNGIAKFLLTVLMLFSCYICMLYSFEKWHSYWWILLVTYGIEMSLFIILCNEAIEDIICPVCKSHNKFDFTEKLLKTEYAYGPDIKLYNNGCGDNELKGAADFSKYITKSFQVLRTCKKCGDEHYSTRKSESAIEQSSCPKCQGRYTEKLSFSNVYTRLNRSSEDLYHSITNYNTKFYHVDYSCKCNKCNYVMSYSNNNSFEFKTYDKNWEAINKEKDKREREKREEEAFVYIEIGNRRVRCKKDKYSSDFLMSDQESGVFFRKNYRGEWEQTSH